MTLQTEFPFTLPRGYVDEGGTLHREGVMRLATARDEIEPLRDARVKENEAYLTVIVLSRTMVKLATGPPPPCRYFSARADSDDAGTASRNVRRRPGAAGSGSGPPRCTRVSARSGPAGTG